MNETKSLKVIQAQDSGMFAVSIDTNPGHVARGCLNFDQVVALLEQYFIFKDETEFTTEKVEQLLKTYAKSWHRGTRSPGDTEGG